MEIFGLNLGTAELSLLALLVPLSGWVILHRLTLWREVNTRKFAARAAYRLAFDDVLLNIRENPDCSIAQIAFSCHPQHLSAIDKFRSTIKFWQRGSFERAVASYKVAHDTAGDFGSVFAVVLSENTEIARAKRKRYREAIERLLSYA